jgi:hypothetical protein
MQTEKHYQFSPNQAVRLFSSDPEWTMKAGVGGMLYALSAVLILINPLFFPIVVCLLAAIQGYIILLIHGRVKDPAGALPQWKSLGELLIAGLTWMAIASLQTMFVFGIALGTIAFGFTFGSDSIISPKTAAIATLLWTFIMMLIAVNSFFSTYLLASFAARQEIVAAFDFPELLRRLIKHPLPMLQGWLLTVGLWAVAIILPIATIIGTFLIPSTTFIAQSLSAQILAQIWRNTDPTDDQLGSENSGSTEEQPS